ncbi:hypothetical protein D3C75_568230 [compost metagenome]
MSIGLASYPKEEFRAQAISGRVGRAWQEGKPVAALTKLAIAELYILSSLSIAAQYGSRFGRACRVKPARLLPAPKTRAAEVHA